MTSNFATEFETPDGHRTVAGPDAAWELRRGLDMLERLDCPGFARTLAQGPTAEGGWWALRESLTPATGGSPAAWRTRLAHWLTTLARLHEAGWVHGALTADSLGLAADGRAKIAHAGRGWRIGQAVSTGATSDTAPEVLTSGRVDGRTDLYMLGRAIETMLAPEARGPFAELVERLAAEAPRDRFASAAEALAFLKVAGTPAAPTRLATPFVGRRAELAQAMQLAEETLDESSVRTLTVHGEAGVGKTRLLEELRARLWARGFAVAASRAGATSDNGAFSAWLPLVDALLCRVDAETRSALAPVLAAVLPGLGVEPVSALEPRAERMRLFRAIATLIETAAGDSGLALFLDNWHRADGESVELWRYLQRAMPAVPLLVVFASQAAPEAGDDGLPLGRFGAGEIRALARGLWDGRDPDGGVSHLEEVTGGHPALVEEAVLECVGAVAGNSRPSAAIRAQLQSTGDFVTHWGRKLAGRSAAARAVAAAATLCGASAPLALLRGVARLDDQAFLDALDELTSSGVLAADGAGFTLLAPAAAVAASGLEAAPEAHAEALRYWQTASQLGFAVPAGRLAHHALAAGDAAAGCYYATAAARAALRVFALDEAESRLEAAARCLESLADAPPLWALDLTVCRADHARYRGRGAEAEALYHEAIALAERHAPERQGDLKTSLGIALSLQARSDEAMACYAEVRASAEGQVRARAVTAMARLRVRLGQSEAAAALCREALALSAVPSLVLGEAHGLLGLVLITAENPDVAEGLAHLGQAEAIAAETGDRLALTNACMLAGNAQLALGQLKAARASFERYALLTSELGLTDERISAILNMAQVAYEEGRYGEAYAQARLGAECAADAGNTIYEAFGRAYIGLAGSHLGHLAESEDALRDGLALAHRLGNAHLTVQLSLAEMEAALFLGRLGKAEELGLAIQRMQDEGGVSEFAGHHALLMGQLYELAGEVGAATRHLQLARTASERNGSITLAAGVALGLGRAALASGQMAVAQTRGLEALAAGEAAGAALPQLRAHMLLARASHALGYPEATHAHLANAQELAVHLASPHWQALAWGLAAKLTDDETHLRAKACTFLQFYLQQLPPRARQEFMHWPERRELFVSRPTAPLELTSRVPQALAPEAPARGGTPPCTSA